MFPIRDNIPARTTPFVNYVFIALCGLVFFKQLSDDPSRPALIEKYGMIPARITRPALDLQLVHRIGDDGTEVSTPAGPAGVAPILTLLTCIFLHGGWMHFVGNMWFLWIFGDNVEDRFGHLGYFIFYLCCGVLASLSHLLTDAGSTVPTIGASGAIAGVMGAYLKLYPRAQVLTLVPLVIVAQMVVLPAPLFLGVWFVTQLFQGAMSISTLQSAGVAWWAHIGGYVVGFVAAWILDRFHMVTEPVSERRPNAERPGVYRLYPRSR